MKTFTRLLVIALISFATLTGCDGNSGVKPIPRLPPPSLSGWWGSTNSPVIDGLAHFIDCAVAETMELNCRLGTNDQGFLSAIQATVQINGSEVTGTGKFYAAPGTTLPDGSTVADLTISDGGFREGISLDLTIDAAGVSFSASFNYNALIHDRGSDLATVAGNYQRFDIYGDPASFSVNANGVITSQSNSGCVGNGQISIIDANFNVYDVTLDLTSCGALDGIYDGLGLTSFSSDPATNNIFVFDVFTSQSVIDAAAVK